VLLYIQTVMKWCRWGSVLPRRSDGRRVDSSHEHESTDNVLYAVCRTAPNLACVLDTPLIMHLLKFQCSAAMVKLFLIVPVD